MQNASFGVVSPSTNNSTMFVYVVIINLCISASHQQQRPRIVSGPSHPVIGRRQGDVTFMWTFTVWPGKTWNESVEEVGFGIWKAPGYLRTKLMVINKRGEVLIRPNYEDKLSCKFNMSRLQVAVKLYNLSFEDEKQYGFHVEFGLSYNPLTDAASLRLQDPPKIISPLKRNVYLKTGDNLELKCEATGFPYPQVAWTRQGRRIRNQSLVLNRASKNDSGLYLCKAYNTAGEDSMEVTVTVRDILQSTQATASHQQQRPRIVSGPSHPIIGERRGDVTFNWTFTVWPGKTWNESVEEVGFGVWKPPGYLRTKLMVINKRGEVLIRPSYKDKLSCKFNMSRLQVAFKLHNLSFEDEKQYGFHVEFGLSYNPLTDPVTLRLQDTPKIISPLKRNIYLKTGDDLELKREATGFPYPQVTWKRLGGRVGNKSLVLRRVSKGDSGLYLCKAHNTAGEDSMEVIVTIENRFKPTQATVSGATPSEPISHVLIIFAATLSAIITFISLAVLLYCFDGRLKKGTPYARQIDTETHNLKSTTLSL